MPASAILCSTIEEAMEDNPDALARLPHLLETNLSLSAWTAVQPFIAHALAPSRMQHTLSNRCYIQDNGKHFNANTVCIAAHIAIELIAIGYLSQETCGPNVLADSVSSIMAWTIFATQHIDDMIISDASIKLWDSSNSANRTILMDLKSRALIYQDARCKEYLCSLFDLWSCADPAVRSGLKGTWFSIISNLVSSWVPRSTDGSINPHAPGDPLLVAALQVVASRAGVIADQQIEVLHLKSCGRDGTPQSVAPIRLMSLLCRSPELRMAMAARGGIRLLCKLLRRIALAFPPSKMEESEISTRIESGINILGVLLNMLCGPAPVREALHCGALLTIMLLWSHIETNPALQGVYEDSWLLITRRGCSKYFVEGIENWLWFPSIYRVLQRAIMEVEELLTQGFDMHHEPLAYFKYTRKWYHERSANLRSLPRRCSKPKCTSYPAQLFGGVKYCSGCRLVAYCSAECQKEHWNEKHRQECRTLASAYQEKSARSPLSYIDRCALLDALRTHIKQDISSIPRGPFTVVKINVLTPDLSQSESYPKNSSKLEDHCLVQYGRNFDRDAFYEKVARMRHWGGNEPVFVCVVEVPYTVIDVVTVRNLVDGWADPELRKWIVG